MTVRDSEFGFLEEDYLCIDVTKETYTVNDAYINRYRNTVWEGQHYGSSFGKLFFADGTELKRPENTDKILPYIKLAFLILGIFLSFVISLIVGGIVIATVVEKIQGK